MRIFEKHPTLDAYRFGPSFTPYAIVAKDKRFTDAELAAEYWQAFSGVWDGHGKAARLRQETIKRFATLPHHDEVTA